MKIGNLKTNRVQFEILRKFFHISGSLIALLIYQNHLHSQIINYLIALALLCTVFIDWFNIVIILANKTVIANFFTKIMREREKQKGYISGSSWFLISCLILNVFVENMNLVVIAILLLAFCDPISGILDLFYDPSFKYKYYHKLIKVLSFFFSGLILIFIYSKYFAISLYQIDVNKLYLSLISTIFVDLILKRIEIDDNITIPISFALIYEMF